MPVWETHSRSAQQTVLSIGCMVMGLILLAWLQAAAPGDANARAGFWFGLVLLILGGLTLIVHARQRVVVDPGLREIRIDDRRLLGPGQSRRIPFAQVREVQLACLQTRSHQAIRYFLQLQLDGGQTCALFAPERVYAGAADPAVVSRWRERLLRCLEEPGERA